MTQRLLADLIVRHSYFCGKAASAAKSRVRGICPRFWSKNRT
jgi:hypothetical protein